MNWAVKSCERSNYGAIVLSLQEGKNVLGRGPTCDLIVNSVTASRKHCSVVLKQGKLYVIDHQSFNGTYIGSLKIPPGREMELKDEDKIGLGINPEGLYPDHPEVDKCVFQVVKLSLELSLENCSLAGNKTEGNLTVNAPSPNNSLSSGVNCVKVSDAPSIEPNFHERKPSSEEYEPVNLIISLPAIEKLSAQKSDNVSSSPASVKSDKIVSPANDSPLNCSNSELSLHKSEDVDRRKTEEIIPKPESKNVLSDDEVIDLSGDDNDNGVDCTNSKSNPDLNYSQIEDDIIVLLHDEDDDDCDIVIDDHKTCIFQNTSGQIYRDGVKIETKKEDDEGFDDVEVFEVYDVGHENKENSKKDQTNSETELKPPEESILQSFGKDLVIDKEVLVEKTVKNTDDVLLDLMSQQEVVEKLTAGEEPGSKRRSSLSDNSKNKKMKTEIIEPLPQKVFKTIRSPKTRKSKRLSDPVPVDLNNLRPYQKRRIREARKSKLKEIADKTKTPEKSSLRLPGNTGNIKVTSKSRSEALSEEIKNSDKPSYKQTKVSAINQKTTDAMAKIVASVISKRNKVGEPEKAKRKSLRFNDENLQTVQMFMPQSQSPDEPQEEPTTQNEVIHQICRWNPKWIKESQSISVLPPLLQDCTLNLIPVLQDSYNSYSDYQRSMYPLMVYEMWDSIVKDAQSLKSEVMTGFVDDVKVSSLSERGSKKTLLMDSIIVQVLCRGNNSLRLGDLVTLKVELKANNKKTTAHLAFGYVTETMKRTNLQHASYPIKNLYHQLKNRYPDDRQVYCLSVKVLVSQRKVRIWSPETVLKVEVVSNVAKDLRLFGCLGKVFSSSLNCILLRPESACIDSDIEKNFVDDPSDNLNDEQKRAISYCSQIPFSDEEAIAVIHGPPGTGKSVTITKLISRTIKKSIEMKWKQKFRILVCSSSNHAVDELVDKLLSLRETMPIEDKLKVVRVGKSDMISSRAKTVSLESLTHRRIASLAKDPELAQKYIKELSAREKWLTSQIDRGKSGPQYNILVQEATELRREIKNISELQKGLDNKMLLDKLSYFIEKEILLKCDVVASTLSSACSMLLRQAFMNRDMRLWGKPFAVCIVDEASQAIELETLSPILLSIDKFILVGDHKQLSPVVLSNQAKEGGLEMSLFERLLKAWSKDPSAYPVFSLTKQFRMHPEILQFPNKKFYNNCLETDASLKFNPYLKPYLVFSHNHQQLKTHDSNPDEATFVCKLLKVITQKQNCQGMSISVITPYQDHKSCLNAKISQSLKDDRIVVQTVDSAQGQERDIVIVSLGKSNGTGFLSNPYRLNVTLTRAKHALYLVGNLRNVTRNCSMWKDLVDNAKERQVLLTVSANCSEATIKDYISDCKKRRSLEKRQ